MRCTTSHTQPKTVVSCYSPFWGKKGHISFGGGGAGGSVGINEGDVSFLLQFFKVFFLGQRIFFLISDKLRLTLCACHSINSIFKLLCTFLQCLIFVINNIRPFTVKTGGNQSNISSNITFLPCWMKCWNGLRNYKIYKVSKKKKKSCWMMLDEVRSRTKFHPTCFDAKI